ncbi:hypothetical protein ACL6C3_21330 [Capilliphycus salinus ALCB114379]|uniref:hypothetical protein n=1 Tax=Capilliphycus salinus TaxID=2768948 RepID=UPI0039A6CF88
MLIRSTPTKDRVGRIVELSKGIKIYTDIGEQNIMLLRLGFAGYPVNLNWSLSKLLAWRQGYQLREYLLTGKMIVRETDSMLVPSTI